MRAVFYCYPMLEREVAKFIRTDGKEMEQLLTSAFAEEALLTSAFAAAAVAATAPAPAVSKVDTATAAGAANTTANNGTNTATAAGAEQPAKELRGGGVTSKQCTI